MAIQTSLRVGFPTAIDQCLFEQLDSHGWVDRVPPSANRESALNYPFADHALREFGFETLDEKFSYRIRASILVGLTVGSWSIVGTVVYALFNLTWNLA